MFSFTPNYKNMLLITQKASIRLMNA